MGFSHRSVGSVLGAVAASPALAAAAGRLAAVGFLAWAALATACKDTGWGDRAPFTAEPPPAAYVRPDTFVTTEVTIAAPTDAAQTTDPPESSRLADHIFGSSAWPCTGHPACDKKSPRDGTLGTAIGSVEFIDPSLVTETEGLQVAINTFEGLISPARRSGGPYEQGVAEAWTLSPDKTTWTFTLRKNARWSNGRTVTAHDFVYAWRRTLDPKVGSQAVEDLYWVAGAEDYNQGKTRDPETIGVRALDDFTLEVKLRCPAAFWPSYLAGGSYAPVPREAVEAHGAKWTEPDHIVTNGPYHLVRFDERDRVELVRSETYWDKDNVKIPRIVLYHGENEAKQRTLYAADQIQWARQAVDPVGIAQLTAAGAKDFFIDPWLCTYFYMFNVEAPPFDDVRVRRAFALAVDRQALVDTVTRGMQTPADGPIPKVFDRTQAFPGAPGPGFDPPTARKLLAEAGYPNGQGFPEVKILYNTLELHKLNAEFIAKQLQEVLGVSVSAENLEWKSLLKRTRAGEFTISRFGACGTDTPFSFLELYQSTSPRNDMRYKNAAFDETVKQYRCAPSEEDARRLGGQAEAMLVADLPALPLYDYTRFYLRWPVLQGLEPHLEDRHPVKYMWWGDRDNAPTPRPMPALVELE